MEPKRDRKSLRRQLAESFERIDEVSDELRVMIARDFPDLLAKLPPRKPPAESIRRTPGRRTMDGQP
jgi:hypothetical protein